MQRGNQEQRQRAQARKQQDPIEAKRHGAEPQEDQSQQQQDQGQSPAPQDQQGQLPQEQYSTQLAKDQQQSRQASQQPGRDRLAEAAPQRSRRALLEVEGVFVPAAPRQPRQISQQQQHHTQAAPSTAPQSGQDPRPGGPSAATRPFRGFQPPAAVQKALLHTELEAMDLRPGQQERLLQAFRPDEAGRLRSILEQFQTLGILSQREVEQTREPENTSSWRRLLHGLKSRLEIYARAGGRSAEELQQVKTLHAVMDVFKMRHGVR